MCLVLREGTHGGFNSVLGHIVTKNFSKIKTEFEFASFYYTLF